MRAIEACEPFTSRGKAAIGELFTSAVDNFVGNQPPVGRKR